MEASIAWGTCFEYVHRRSAILDHLCHHVCLILVKRETVETRTGTSKYSWCFRIIKIHATGETDKVRTTTVTAHLCMQAQLDKQTVRKMRGHV